MQITSLTEEFTQRKTKIFVHTMTYIYIVISALFVALKTL